MGVLSAMILLHAVTGDITARGHSLQEEPLCINRLCGTPCNMELSYEAVILLLAFNISTSFLALKYI